MRCVHQLIICFIMAGMTFQAATLSPSSAADSIGKVLDPTHPRLPQSGSEFETGCGGGCVHDRTTGYFWETTPLSNPLTLSQAANHCSSLNSVYPPSSLTNDANARARGWSIPYIWEFATLPDPTLPSSSVPPNTFFNVQKSLYWAAGGYYNPNYARLFGAPSGGVGVVQPSVNMLVWCVLSSWMSCTSENPCPINP